MFFIAQFIESLENQGATRGEVEGGRATRAMVKGVWKVSDAILSRETIEAALSNELSATHKRELPKSEGRFWFRIERPLGAWMVCVHWNSSSVLPRRTLTFVSQNSVAFDPLEATETPDLSSAENIGALKSSAPQAFSPDAKLGAKSGAAPRNLEQMQQAARSIPPTPPLVPPPTTAPWKSEAPPSAPPPLPVGFSPPPTRSVSPDAGKHWEPPTYTPPTPSAVENALDAVSPVTWRVGFSLVGVAISLLLLGAVRGCNAAGSYSPMLAKAIRKDANASQKWRDNGVALDEVRLHKIDDDSYEGTGIYSDGRGATVEVEIETWTWSNTPATWDYKVTPQAE